MTKMSDELIKSIMFYMTRGVEEPGLKNAADFYIYLQKQNEPPPGEPSREEKIEILAKARWDDEQTSVALIDRILRLKPSPWVIPGKGAVGIVRKLFRERAARELDLIERAGFTLTSGE